MTRATGLVTGAMTLGVIAQAVPAPLPDAMDFWRWALQQGGLVTAIALLLFFWRRTEQQRLAREVEFAGIREREWAERLQEKQDENEERKAEQQTLLSVVRDNSAAMARTSAAMDNLSGVITRMADRNR